MVLQHKRKNYKHLVKMLQKIVENKVNSMDPPNNLMKKEDDSMLEK